MTHVLVALDLLPAAERQVVVLHHVLGLPPAEVARRVDRPPARVRDELARGTARLARLLQEAEATAQDRVAS